MLPRALPLAVSFTRFYSLRAARVRRPDPNVAVMLAKIKHAHQVALTLADERLKETCRIADERLKETSRVADERLKETSRVADERLKEMSRVADQTGRVADERLKEMSRVADERLKEIGERLVEVRLAATERYARVLYELDIARGHLDARPLLEQCLFELRRLTARGGDGVRSGGSKGAMSQVIDELLPTKAGVPSSCPGLVAYLTVAAEDNDMRPEQVLRSAKELYADLSKLSHTIPIGMPKQLPEELFNGWGAESRVAFEAIVTFTGRRLSFYAYRSTIATTKLRNISGCHATVETIRAASLVE